MATTEKRGGLSVGAWPRARRWARSLVLALAAGSATFAACNTVPITGRRALNAFSPAEDVTLGREAYAQVLAEGKVVTSGPEVALVRRVMRRLVAVADDAGYEWEVNLLDAPDTVNAFALPGGKMAVYTGILPVTQTEAGLAVVMGHEIGHVVARHGTERMTRAYGTQMIVGLITNKDYGTLAQGLLNLLVELPYGRSQESEADRIGQMYMARAGYDPAEAIRLWQRMEKLTGSSGPEFLSTHPSHATRIADLQRWLPEAEAAYEASGGPPGGR
ncbi:MAG TPA: M48 family peptidase [Planctomycetes bacterium]|nr:M48 family peptidase [Planctomycetota bacterium]